MYELTLDAWIRPSARLHGEELTNSRNIRILFS